MKNQEPIDFTPLSKLAKQDKTQTSSSGSGHTKFLNMIYKAKEDLHLAHNVQKTKDHSVHSALGDIYTAFDDMIDGFVESVFGIYGPAELQFSTQSISDPVGYLKSLYSSIDSERTFFKESWIQNEIDVFQKEIALTLYKLQYVRSNP